MLAGNRIVDDTAADSTECSLRTLELRIAGSSTQGALGGCLRHEGPETHSATKAHRGGQPYELEARSLVLLRLPNTTSVRTATTNSTFGPPVSSSLKIA